jgi:hypothetical protein
VWGKHRQFVFLDKVRVRHGGMLRENGVPACRHAVPSKCVSRDHIFFDAQDTPTRNNPACILLNFGKDWKSGIDS